MAVAERITAGKVNEVLVDHLTRHKDVIDPILDRHDKLLYGEKHDNGMVKQMTVFGTCFDDVNKRLGKIEAGVDKVIWIVLLGVIGAILALVLK